MWGTACTCDGGVVWSTAAYGWGGVKCEVVVFTAVYG